METRCPLFLSTRCRAQAVAVIDCVQVPVRDSVVVVVRVAVRVTVGVAEPVNVEFRTFLWCPRRQIYIKKVHTHQKGCHLQTPQALMPCHRSPATTSVKQQL